VSDESIECSHVEWVYAEDRCALCGITAADLIVASQASFAAHMREAAAPKSPKEWASQVQEEFLKSESGQLLQKIAFAAREAAELWSAAARCHRWRSGGAASACVPCPSAAYGPWTIGDLVE
jgi:hypothetical protein